jgi:hypothetical protein
VGHAAKRKTCRHAFGGRLAALGPSASRDPKSRVGGSRESASLNRPDDPAARCGNARLWGYRPA